MPLDNGAHILDADITLDVADHEVAELAANLIRLRREGFVPERDILVAFTADEVVKRTLAGEKVLLVRKETSPEDVEGISGRGAVAFGQPHLDIAGEVRGPLDLKVIRLLSRGA